jgi:hypothetical protein
MVPGQGPEQRESGKTVLYPLIVIIILISYTIIKLLIKRRTFPAKTRNGTLKIFSFPSTTFLLRLVSIARLRQRESSKTVLCLQGGAAEPEISWRVSHPSIIQALCCLTSMFEWKLVYQTRKIR